MISQYWVDYTKQMDAFRNGEHVLRFQAKEAIGEVSLLDGAPRPTDMVAAVDSRVLVIDQHFLAGGYCMSFHRRGSTLDAGIDTICGARRGSQFWRVLEGSGVASRTVTWCSSSPTTRRPTSRTRATTPRSEPGRSSA